MTEQPTYHRFIQRWWITRITQPLAFAAFAAGVVLSCSLFPGEFDWRYTVISALQSPQDNPRGYLWLAAGFGLSGALFVPLARYFRDVLSAVSPRGARTVHHMLMAGALGTLMVAVFTHRPALYPRLHEGLALFAYVALVAGLLTAALLFIRHPETTLLAHRRRRWVLPLLSGAIFGTILAAASAQMVLYAFPVADLGWVDISWRERGIPPYLSFAFWQWILSFLLYLSAWVLAWLARPRTP